MNRHTFDLILIEFVLLTGALTAVRMWAGKEIDAAGGGINYKVAKLAKGVTG